MYSNKQREVAEESANRPIRYDGKMEMTSSRKRPLGRSFSVAPRFVQRKLDYGQHESDGVGKTKFRLPSFLCFQSH